MKLEEIQPQTDQVKIYRINQISFKWLAGKILYLKQHKTFPGAINAGNYINQKLFGLGDMFMYHYDPKWKKELPYYDTFPLVIPINFAPNGFLGLNLHYLSPDLRLIFINRLIRLTTVKLDQNTKLAVTYSILKDSQDLNMHIPCLKRYLSSHVQGRMMRIFPHEWIFAANIPTDAFQKASKGTVWADSRKKINGF